MEIYPLTVVEARSPRPRFLQRPFFLACREQSSLFHHLAFPGCTPLVYLPLFIRILQIVFFTSNLEALTYAADKHGPLQSSQLFWNELQIAVAVILAWGLAHSRHTIKC
jgi:hypothetical protein